MKDKIKIINRDQLKYIAAFLMLVGHFMLFTSQELKFFGLPSGIIRPIILLQYVAPPVFMFFIAEGFYFTKNRAKYAVRLLISGIVTQFTFVLANTGTMDWNMFVKKGNVIFTLLLSLLILMINDSKLKVPLKIFLDVIVLGVNYLMSMEWAILGPAMVFVFYMLRDKPWMRFAVYEFLTIGYVIISMGGIIALIQNTYFLIVFQIPIILITFFYNGKKGKFPRFSKHFFYIFYPAHMLLIFVVRNIAG